MTDVIPHARKLVRAVSPPVPELKGAIKGLLNELDAMREQLRDCEVALRTYDRAGNSLYWSRHTVQPSTE